MLKLGLTATLAAVALAQDDAPETPAVFNAVISHGRQIKKSGQWIDMPEFSTLAKITEIETKEDGQEFITAQEIGEGTQLPAFTISEDNYETPEWDWEKIHADHEENPQNVALKTLVEHQEDIESESPYNQARLFQMFRSGMEIPSSNVGVYLQFEDDYSRFKQYLEPMIKELHGVDSLEQDHDFARKEGGLQARIAKLAKKTQTFEDLVPSELRDQVPKDGDLDLAKDDVEVRFMNKDENQVSMRIRSGRNLARESFRFPAQMTLEEHKEMAMGSARVAVELWTQYYAKECGEDPATSPCKIVSLTPRDTIVKQFHGKTMTFEKWLTERKASTSTKGKKQPRSLIDYITFVEPNTEEFAKYQKSGILFEDQIGDEYLRRGNVGKNYPIGRGAFDVPGKVRLYYGEEDDLRIQAVKMGTKIQEVFDEFSKFLRAIEKEYTREAYIRTRASGVFAQHEGVYIMSCPSNAGTGMRAGVMGNLKDALKMEENDGRAEQEAELNKVLDNASLPARQFRGTQGEHSPFDAKFGTVDLSPKQRFGKTEVQIALNLYMIARKAFSHNNMVKNGLLSDAQTAADSEGSAADSQGSLRGSHQG